MKSQNSIYLILTMLTLACVKSYEPAPVKAQNNFLVVDGMINASPNSESIITLSRTRNLADTVLFDPEPGALVYIQSNSGNNYPLLPVKKGVYGIDNLSLNPNDQYRLDITTNDGKKYVSAYVPVNSSPPIDSLSWKQQDGDVNVYVHTHDPGNSTKYYRWEYKETWEYHSTYETDLYVSNHYIYYTDSSNQIYKCWDSAYSTNIITASTLNLDQDVVSYQPVAVVPNGSAKIKIKYSILVKQFALTQEAHQFWEILKRNTQQLGTLFDPQPSQLKGNVLCVSNPGEPVVGFVSAGTVSEKRIFIDPSSLQDWVVHTPGLPCDTAITPINRTDPRIFDYPNPDYAPYFYCCGFVLTHIIIAYKPCLDCTERGGTNKKPSYWK